MSDVALLDCIKLMKRGSESLLQVLLLLGVRNQLSGCVYINGQRSVLLIMPQRDVRVAHI